MRKAIILVALVTALMSTMATGAEARNMRLVAQLQPVDGGTVHGRVVWRGVSASDLDERFPLHVRIQRAEPFSELSLRVCGPSVTVYDGTSVVSDMCWATFYDKDRHILTFPTGRRGRANVWLSPKLGVGPTYLETAERVELMSGDVVIATGVLEERGHP
jgi:hypothetical protein